MYVDFAVSESLGLNFLNRCTINEDDQYEVNNCYVIRDWWYNHLGWFLNSYPKVLDQKPIRSYRGDIKNSGAIGRVSIPRTSNSTSNSTGSRQSMYAFGIRRKTILRINYS